MERDFTGQKQLHHEILATVKLCVIQFMMCEFNQGIYDAKLVILFLASHDFQNAVLHRTKRLRKLWCRGPQPFVYPIPEVPAQYESDQEPAEDEPPKIPFNDSKGLDDSCIYDNLAETDCPNETPSKHGPHQGYPETDEDMLLTVQV